MDSCAIGRRMHVDGFRFDLPRLARPNGDFSPDRAALRLYLKDPCCRVKFIADLDPLDGRLSVGLSPRWSEWNDRFATTCASSGWRGRHAGDLAFGFGGRATFRTGKRRPTVG